MILEDLIRTCYILQVWDLCFSVFGENSIKNSSILVHATPSNVQVKFALFFIHEPIILYFFLYILNPNLIFRLQLNEGICGHHVTE